MAIVVLLARCFGCRKEVEPSPSGLSPRSTCLKPPIDCRPTFWHGPSSYSMEAGMILAAVDSWDLVVVTRRLSHRFTTPRQVGWSRCLRHYSVLTVH